VLKPPRIAPSLLAADFARLGEEMGRLEDHVDWWHVDVMDGHFVPNLAIGVPVVASLARHTRLLIDCHLMITNPRSHLERFRDAGAGQVTVHIEVEPDPGEVAAAARRLGIRFGLVLNPPTPAAAVEPFLGLCDVVLVMSVDPGFGGQEFMPQVLEKVHAVRTMVDARGMDVDVQIDGGISPDTAAAARLAGADVFVAGAAVFRSDDPLAAVQRLREAVEGA